MIGEVQATRRSTELLSKLVDPISGRNYEDYRLTRRLGRNKEQSRIANALMGHQLVAMPYN